MRFNRKTEGSTRTINYEGDVAYTMSPELELYSTVCTAALQNKFYESADETIKRIRKLIKMVDPEFVAKLAIYAREQMYLRSVPLVLAVELARVHNGDSLVSKMTERIIQRADELTEILAYYQESNKSDNIDKLSKQIQKGVARAFLKFDEYQFAKYNKKTKIRIRDAMFLTHPRPEHPDQVELFRKVASDTLETPYTWEVQLSASNDKKRTWEELISSGRVGYMATLRNLRNILEAGVSLEHIKRTASFISNKEQALKSKQLPFRFFSAYKMLQAVDSDYTPIFLDALENAVVHTTKNIRGFGYDTSVLIACDVSGSMETPISRNSSVEMYDIGLILAMLLQNRCKRSITGIFGDTWETVQLPRTSILQNAIQLHEIEGRVGYSTNGWKVIEHLIDNEIRVDKVMIFTDCQLWDSTLRYKGNKGAMNEYWSRYKNSIAPDCKLYLFDLDGYGTTPVSTTSSDVFLISGWSDKIFKILDALENGSSAIEEINKIGVE